AVRLSTSTATPALADVPAPLRVDPVRIDDALHQLVPDDVLAVEQDEGEVLDVAQDLAHLDQTGALSAWQVDLRDIAGDDHLRAEPEAGEGKLHLLWGGVLRLVAYN